MLIAGVGAGQVRYLQSKVENKLIIHCRSFYNQTFQTTTVAAQASVARQDMSVVTDVRNVRYK